MEENKNEVPQGPEFLPPEAIKADLGIKMTKLHGNYKEALEQLLSVIVTEETIPQVQQYLKNVSGFIGSIEDNRKTMKEPSLEYGRRIDGVHKDFAAPFITGKEEIQRKLNIVAKAMADRLEKERQQKEKEASVRGLINNFVIDFSVKIASATSNEQLLGYERLINLEKGNKAKYADQLPLLRERCNELTDKIKEQKELIREKERLDAEKKKAEADGDDEKINTILQKEKDLDDKIEENTILVQENAASGLLNDESTDDVAVLKARRTTWKAELINQKEAVKKCPEMLDISLNADKVRETMATLKSAGVFNGKKEYILNGIRYYEEKTF